MKRSNKVKLEIILTSAQKKDIERTLDKHCQINNVDRGRQLQLILADYDLRPIEQ